MLFFCTILEVTIVERKDKIVVMSPEEIAKLENLVNKLKFNASQKAGDLHDLIEDRLLTDFEDIPLFAEEAFKACKDWSEKNKELLKVISA